METWPQGSTETPLCGYVPDIKEGWLPSIGMLLKLWYWGGLSVSPSILKLWVDGGIVCLPLYTEIMGGWGDCLSPGSL